MSRLYAYLSLPYALLLVAPPPCAHGLIGDQQSLAQEAPATLTARQAADHVGELVTVCGKVASATYASRSRGKPTFLNLDKPYANHIFTIVIWGENREKFAEAPERLYRDQRVCATGTIETYRGKPQIEVTDPGQLGND